MFNVKAWLSSVWDSTDSLLSIGYWAQGILALTLLVTFAFTVVALVSTYRKDVLSREREKVKDVVIADLGAEVARANQKVAEANERAAVARRSHGRSRRKPTNAQRNFGKRRRPRKSKDSNLRRPWLRAV